MTGKLPQPLATAAVRVAHDPVTRSLFVKPAPDAGYAGFLFGEGHRALTAAQEAGRVVDSVWGSGSGRDIPGEPVRDGWLRFKFYGDDPAYKKLANTPDLGAIVVVDRGTRRILRVRFRGN
jgi:hypothetical protein